MRHVHAQPRLHRGCMAHSMRDAPQGRPAPSMVEPMRPERPARCRYSDALAGGSMLYTWLRRDGDTAGVVCAVAATPPSAVESSVVITAQSARSPPVHRVHHCTSCPQPCYAPAAPPPDGRQVQPSCGGRRAQQQRGLVVPEGVQRLDGLCALRQQHCQMSGRRGRFGGCSAAGRQLQTSEHCKQIL